MTVSGSISGPGANPGYLPGSRVSGRFYGPRLLNQPANGALGANNRLYAIPYFQPVTGTALSLIFNIGTGIAGAWNARMGIYRCLPNGLPGDLVTGSDTLVAVSAGSVTGAQTGSVNGGSGVVLAGPAWYFLAFVADTSGQSLFSTTGAMAAEWTSVLFGGATATQAYSGNGTGGVYQAHAFGALPATFSTSPTYNSNALVPIVAVGF